MKKLVKVPVVTVTEEKDTIIEEDGGMLELHLGSLVAWQLGNFCGRIYMNAEEARALSCGFSPFENDLYNKIQARIKETATEERLSKCGVDFFHKTYSQEFIQDAINVLLSEGFAITTYYDLTSINIVVSW